MSAAQGVAVSTPPTATVVLVGLAKKDQDFLQELLECSSSPAGECQWAIHPKASISSTLSALRRAPIQVVLCDRDWNPEVWKELLEHFACLNEPPCLIVTSRLADEYLWAEALNRGAYDVLARPFDRTEVLRTVCLARQHWHSRYGSRPAVMQSVA